ncbi:MAG TPA: sensor histidine kinase, partial [Clostridiales bacterium]|nr:sensor histidine kinase [Clostridiales bacterium]
RFTVISERTLKILDYVVNYAAWMLLLSALYVCLLSLRQVFTLGLKRYFKERTIFGVILVWFVRLVKRIFRSLGKINLTDSSNKAIMKILAVNFIILLIMMSVWVFGIPILFLYTIILFFILRKYLDDIKNKYAILLSATSIIAEGNLEGTIEEDLGVFEPLKGELAKVQNGFKKAVIEETKSQRLKTDLITNVSHDLKTPLTAIITYVDLLKNKDLTLEERTSYVETLDKKSQRLKRLIEDLFEVSKASSNNITINKIEINIVNLLEQVLLELDDKIKESNVEFRFNPLEEKILVNLDSEKTYRIFENLIINITKYAIPHSRAYIDIELGQDFVEIILKNVSASELDFNLDVISERFVRGDESRNTDGSGLGLAIVKSFVELQGGKFTIQTDGDLFKAIVEFPME